MDLREIMDRLMTNWKCTEVEYPLVRRMTTAERMAFRQRHALHHLHKALGRLSEVADRQDHGTTEQEDVELAHESAGKLVCAAMYVAMSMGFTAEGLGVEIAELFPFRTATPDELRQLMNAPELFFELLGMEPVCASMRVDGKGVRISVGLKAGSERVPPAEIRFPVGDEIVSARIEPYVEDDEIKPQRRA